MAEKKTAKKENSEVDLNEILGNIKTVVSEEKEALFKVSNYKTINLKKENLINPGKKIIPLHQPILIIKSSRS